MPTTKTAADITDMPAPIRCNAHKSAEALIDRSLSHNEIVSAPWTSVIAANLFAACDGDVYDSGRDVHEYWGATEDEAGERSEWRVHLSGAPQ